MAGARWVALALIISACSSPSVATSTTNSEPVVVIANHGGSLEGHTPRGFAGMGTGLFVGDNLNPGFPEGDGVQMFLTFDLSNRPDRVSSAVLASDVMTVRGSPFDDLGGLTAELIEYQAFGPELFDLEATSRSALCERVGETGLSCDITDLIRDLDIAATAAQFRLRFELPGDGDGRPDLAMFFITDSNTNQPGLFTLTLVE